MYSGASRLMIVKIRRCFSLVIPFPFVAPLRFWPSTEPTFFIHKSGVFCLVALLPFQLACKIAGPCEGWRMRSSGKPTSRKTCSWWPFYHHWTMLPYFTWSWLPFFDKACFECTLPTAFSLMLASLLFQLVKSHTPAVTFYEEHVYLTVSVPSNNSPPDGWYCLHCFLPQFSIEIRFHRASQVGWWKTSKHSFPWNSSILAISRS